WARSEVLRFEAARARELGEAEDEAERAKRAEKAEMARALWEETEAQFEGRLQEWRRQSAKRRTRPFAVAFAVDPFTMMPPFTASTPTHFAFTASSLITTAAAKVLTPSSSPSFTAAPSMVTISSSCFTAASTLAPVSSVSSLSSTSVDSGSS
ncbi:unnamed protein product, partial [Closterium sp. Naga37s-1]